MQIRRTSVPVPPIRKAVEFDDILLHNILQEKGRGFKSDQKLLTE